MSIISIWRSPPHTHTLQQILVLYYLRKIILDFFFRMPEISCLSQHLDEHHELYKKKNNEIPDIFNKRHIRWVGKPRKKLYLLRRKQGSNIPCKMLASIVLFKYCSRKASQVGYNFGLQNFSDILTNDIIHISQKLRSCTIPNGVPNHHSQLSFSMTLDNASWRQRSPVQRLTRMLSSLYPK